MPTRFLINQCQIITFLILKSDNIENSRTELKGIVFPVPTNQIKKTSFIILPYPSTWYICDFSCFKGYVVPTPSIKLLGEPPPPPPPPPSSYAYARGVNLFLQELTPMRRNLRQKVLFKLHIFYSTPFLRFFSFQNSPKNLDSYNLWDYLEKVKCVL